MLATFTRAGLVAGGAERNRARGADSIRMTSNDNASYYFVKHGHLVFGE